MQDALRDMVRWSLGFGVVALLYLVLGGWLLRRFQQRRPTGHDGPTAPAPQTAPGAKPREK